MDIQKFDEIYWKYAPKGDYVRPQPINIFPWLILGDLNDATIFNGNAVLSIINDSYYHTDKFKNKEWHVIDIMDSKDTPINDYFNEAFNFLDRIESENKTCIIHCQAGINRSATIALAYYIKKTGTPLFEAYEKFSKMRPGIIYNTGFRKCLFNWYKTLESPLEESPLEESPLNKYNIKY